MTKTMIKIILQIIIKKLKKYQKPTMQDPYKTYRSMPQKHKHSLIESAKQSEKYRKPNPQGIHEFQ